MWLIEEACGVMGQEQCADIQEKTAVWTVFQISLGCISFPIVFQLLLNSVFEYLTCYMLFPIFLVIFQISKQYIQLTSYYKIQVFLTPRSLILKYKTHCILLCPTVLYLAKSVLKSILGIFLNNWLGNFLTAFGKYCGNTLGVVKLQTVSRF